MHQYMRAIGFSQLTDRKELQKLLTDIVVNGTERTYTSNGEKTLLATFARDYAEGMGIAVCGEFGEDDRFTYDYYFPYLKGTMVSSGEDVTVERHAAQEAYSGVCDDVKIGITLIFYLQNMISYVKLQNAGQLPVKGTSVSLSALSIQGTILMPLMKTEKDLIQNQRASVNRSQLISAARKGDEEAIENLTLEDMDTYSAISRRILNEDVFSLVDTYFMPYGVECDQYSIMAEILEYRIVKNELTEEEIYLMTVSCNDLEFELCINKEDLYGEPAIGRRFKGIIWMQGYINFPV